MFDTFKKIDLWLKYLIMLILINIFKYFYPEYISFLFIIIIILIPLFLLVYVIVGVFFIKINLELKSKVVIRNEEIKLNVLINNKSFLPFSMIEIKYSLPQKVGLPSENKTVCFNILAKKKYKCEEKIICKHIGVYKSKLEFIKISDLFGFFKFKLKSKSEVELLVLPRRTFIPKFNNNLFSELKNSIIMKTNINTYDIFGTRNYIAGDELRLVHWKNSAKTDDIVIKEFEEKKDITNLIILDLKKYYDNEKNYNYIDAVVEMAVSIIDKLISDRIKTDIIWYEQNQTDIKLKTLESISEMNDFFKQIVCLDSYKNDISLEKILNTRIIYANYSVLFIITAYIDSNLINYLNKFDMQIFILHLITAPQSNLDYKIHSNIILIDINYSENQNV